MVDLPHGLFYAYSVSDRFVTDFSTLLLQRNLKESQGSELN